MQSSPIFVANWKMCLGSRDSQTLSKVVVEEFGETEDVSIVLCPSFPALSFVEEVIRGSRISLGVQNMFWKEEGAYTGEVSPRMLQELGCRFVILGHSERRTDFHETNEEIQKKLHLAVRLQFTPILCVGETREEREEGKIRAVIEQELSSVLPSRVPPELLIAYEPIWAIGTGNPIKPEGALEATLLIRSVLQKIFSSETAENRVKILYGGSVDDKNILDFVDGEHIQGVLVGGASTKKEQLTSIIRKLSLIHAH